ncbi:MAG: heme exporter protein CcmD [Steroidobacteraceae bacterium]
MTLGEFLNMGGYAGYVWTSYGLTTFVLVANWVSARRIEAEQQKLALRRSGIEKEDAT